MVYLNCYVREAFGKVVDVVVKLKAGGIAVFRCHYGPSTFTLLLLS